MKWLALLVCLAVAPVACAACGSPPLPKGPPPEYEEPAAPTWLDGGASQAPPAAQPPRDAAAD